MRLGAIFAPHVLLQWHRVGDSLRTQFSNPFGSLRVLPSLPFAQGAVPPLSFFDYPHDLLPATWAGPPLHRGCVWWVHLRQLTPGGLLLSFPSASLNAPLVVVVVVIVIIRPDATEKYIPHLARVAVWEGSGVNASLRSIKARPPVRHVPEDDFISSCEQLVCLPGRVLKRRVWRPSRIPSELFFCMILAKGSWNNRKNVHLPASRTSNPRKPFAPWINYLF